MTMRQIQIIPVRNKTLVAAAMISSLVVLSACKDNQYLARRDTITLGAGDAMAANRAVHTIDPWPQYSKNKNLPADGKRMMVGIKRYQENKSLEPVGTDTTERFEQEDPPESPPGPSPSN